MKPHDDVSLDVPKDGFAGRLAKGFIHSKLTPVIVVTSLLLGVFAVFVTPKEEEPQISVPMIDIQMPAPGLGAREVERKVVEPIERAVWGLDGVEYVYSSSRAHGALVTVRFKVGEPIEPSLVKVHHKLMTVRAELPKEALDPIVKSYSIDDVPFLTLTFSSRTKSDYELRQAVTPLARELSSTPDLSRVEVLGGLRRAIRVIANPAKLQSRGVSLLSLAEALRKNDALLPGQKTWGDREVFDVEIGGRFSTAEEIAKVAIGQRGGGVVRIGDVAEVLDGPEERVRGSLLVSREAKSAEHAVSIVFAKRKGTNVVTLTKQLLKRADVFRRALPSDVNYSITRDYGSTAEAKSNELIEHLLIATFSVAALIALFMGIRASIVVAIAIPVTLALTLAIYYFLGYTLNRVTLFALIFSIGILVDDAIVVVENIERHLHLDHRKGLVRATLDAVAEVGNPTILATFTVIASILPMAFVRGLMGPYMKPIPVGASLAMIVSLFVAFIVTPWAAIRLMKHEHPSESAAESRLDRLYRKVMQWLLESRKHAALFGAGTIALLLLAMSLVYFKTVKVKMLPFDNKNEFQVLVDFPSTTPLVESLRRSEVLARKLLEAPEVEKVQIYAGEPAPYSFSGMVKHTFLRGSDEQVDLQIVLKDKDQRKRQSHAVIESIRPWVSEFGKANGAVTKVLEIPPGPPVLATVLAEIYGPDEATRRKVAKEVYAVFESVPSVVDLDSTLRPGRPRKRYAFDYQAGGVLGLNASSVAAAGALTFGETRMGSLRDVSSPEEIGVVLSVSEATRSSEKPFAGQSLPSFESGSATLAQAVRSPVTEENETLYRKNLKPVEYVMSELSGAEEAPVYGLGKIQPKIAYDQQTAEVPWDTETPKVKWDGEWFITYEVFRDLGGAFGIVMILIYILVLGWFRSFALPLIIMAPIPISLIGILPGHALAGFYFGAPSMIGFIAGAGIIVRNSIILVDFIEHQLAEGKELKDAIVTAGVVRFRPMLLTAAAVVVGSSVMLMDPIFQGLAISLIFGEVAATLISRFAVPMLYYWFVGRSRVRELAREMKGISI
ncbi:MAG: efflux RND transporter permease subunit [Bdellovibrionales bacterium]|nr:efflux RND transporter permease subunit [Bdellovibrionales bacterium]